MRYVLKCLVSRSRPVPSQTIYIFELLRFVACVGVILWHYQHFITYRGGQYVPNAMPFASVFGWFYQNGHKGVQIFWCLSGIIFAHVYQLGIANRQVTTVQFIWKRITRLYPLHILTLLLVAISCVVYRNVTSLHNFIYQFNDVKHFFLNLIFANYWGFQSGFSFNGPVWSVSIELIAYAIFFIIALLVRLLPTKLHCSTTFLLVWIICLVLIYRSTSGSNNLIPVCVALFMTGAIIYTAWTVLPDLVVFVLICYLVADFFIFDSLHKLLLPIQLPFSSLTIALLLTALACSKYLELSRSFKSIAKRLGSLTYAMYMIHFPIQLVMVTFSEAVFHINFFSHLVFIMFFTVVFILGIICHDKFEAPVQHRLRAKSSSALRS